MALPDQIAAYEDCDDVFTRAHDDPIGARALFPSYEEAFRFRMRMHQYRTLLRKESRRLYEPTDPRYNKSEYDKLLCAIREDTEGNFWVYVERHGQNIQAVEALSED